MTALRVALATLVLSACAPDEREPGDGESDVGEAAADAAPTGFLDAAAPADEIDGGAPTAPVDPPAAVVFAHTASTLYRVDAETLAITGVGDFVWPAGIDFDEMTDIAVNKSGEVFGVSFTRVYRVDPATAVCVFLAPLSGTTFNALSFLPDGAGGEVLVGASGAGDLYTIDTTTGVSTLRGSYGGMGSSGDLVSVIGDGTYATVVSAGVEYLARVDPATGAATLLPQPTGVSGIWGLGYWKGKVFGFSSSSGFVIIDTTTGVATLAPTSSTQSWWGAGVTTRAVVID
jgi:streptogramin lyase